MGGLGLRERSLNPSHNNVAIFINLDAVDFVDVHAMISEHIAIDIHLNFLFLIDLHARVRNLDDHGRNIVDGGPLVLDMEDRGGLIRLCVGVEVGGPWSEGVGDADLDLIGVVT